MAGGPSFKPRSNSEFASADAQPVGQRGRARGRLAPAYGPPVTFTFGPMVTYSLDDGEELNQRYPDSFWIPPRPVRASLEPGRIVKLIFRLNVDGGEHVERMWVVIRSRDGERYVGELDNDPYCTTELRAGAEVQFSAEHVIQVHEDDA